jgi:hypothetical protein
VHHKHASIDTKVIELHCVCSASRAQACLHASSSMAQAKASRHCKSRSKTDYRQHLTTKYAINAWKHSLSANIGVMIPESNISTGKMINFYIRFAENVTFENISGFVIIRLQRERADLQGQISQARLHIKRFPNGFLLIVLLYCNGYLNKIIEIIIYICGNKFVQAYSMGNIFPPFH